MKEIITGRLAKRIDGIAINELGIPSLKLMDSAAEAVADTAKEAAVRIMTTGKSINGGLKEDSDKSDISIRVFAGAGNNGADGVLCAVKLIKAGYTDTEVYFCGKEEKESPEFKIQKAELLSLGKSLHDFRKVLGEKETLPEADDNRDQTGNQECVEKNADIIIDALFGIGLTREVKGDFSECIDIMNRAKGGGAFVISVDVPSGLNSDTGENMCKRPVAADITVTFGYAKTGFYMGYGYGNCGEIRVKDIGYPEGILSEDEESRQDVLYMQEDSDIQAMRLSERDIRANKSDYGKLVIAAGSEGMAGAAFFSGLAAFKTGAGMVKYLGPEENRGILQTLLPEAMYDSVGEDLGELSCDAEVSDELSCDNEAYAKHNRRITDEKIRNSIAWAGRRGCVVLGPGLGRSEYARYMTETVIRLLYEYNNSVHEGSAENKKPAVYLVADGDALNMISEKKELLDLLKGYAVLTPHVGEMSRLTGKSTEEIKHDPVEISRKFFNDTGINIILKDSVSVIPGKNSKTYINTSGNAALAKAGSGDVLTGILGALIMREGFSEETIASAAYIHGRAGVMAAERYGLNGTLARDIAEAVPEAVEDINR